MQRLWWGVACCVIQATAQAGVEVRDDLGRVIRLDAPAQRIVSLAPHATELLFEVGAGERVVGTVSFSDYPPAATRIPLIGRYDRFDLEAIAARRPDLVIAWHSGNPAQQVERIAALGFPVFYTEARRIEAIPDLLRRLGRVAGSGAQGDAAARRFEQRLAELRRTYRGRAPVRVFYQVWNRPLMTINGEHLISDALRLCGGINVFAELGPLAPTISVEAVLAADPQLIVTGGLGELQSAWLAEWRQWEQLQAVRSGNLALVPPDLLQRPTSRFLDGIEILCRTLERARRPR